MAPFIARVELAGLPYDHADYSNIHVALAAVHFSRIVTFGLTAFHLPSGTYYSDFYPDANTAAAAAHAAAHSAAPTRNVEVVVGGSSGAQRGLTPV